MNYFYYNDFPLSIAKGGKEKQLKLISNYYKDHFDGIYDVNDVNSPNITNDDYIHFFGDTPHFYHFINFLKGNDINPRTFISPSFYRRNAYQYKLLKILPSFIPNWWSERQKLYKEVDKIIVNSNYEKNYLNNIFNIDKNKIEVIYNSFDFKLNKESSIEIDEKFYLCVTHLSERKNIFNLLTAADKIHEKFKIKLYLIGGKRFHNKSSLKKFNYLINKSNGVNFLGLKDSSKLIEYYKNCLFHVLPSFIETPGISNLEAAYFKCPIIVGDFPVLREYFNENAIYTKFDSRSIYNSIEKVIKQGRKNVNYDLSRFQGKSIKKKYVKLLE